MRSGLNGELHRAGKLIRWYKFSGPGLGGELCNSKGMLGPFRQITTSRSDSLGILEIFLSQPFFLLKEVGDFSINPGCLKVVPSPSVYLCSIELQNCSIKCLSLIMKFACRKHLAHLEGTLRARVST